MNAVLQRWCNTSLSLIRSIPFDEHQLIFGGRLPPFDEWSVEWIAFLRLARTRCSRDSIEAAELHRGVFEYEVLQQIFDTCPLTASDPIETLGEIHEYFVATRIAVKANSLGRVTRSRKSTGTHYTPQAVVEYIVGKTLEPRLKQSMPDDVTGLKILDPAAGCGAFLIAAYRHLMNWHLNWYLNHDPVNWPADINATESGWRLTKGRCRSILLNNIFGVDLDATAIAIARRSLWLTQLEFSADNSGIELFADDDESLLFNLKHGNSLIGAAFGVPNHSVSDTGNSFPFDWFNEFPSVANAGGFDVIIGNPPYRRERHFKSDLDEINATELGRFQSPRMDLWYYFVHRGIQLLKTGGTLAYITNAYWMNGVGADKLIATLRDEVRVDELFLLQNYLVFPGVTGQHSIFRLTKRKSDAPIVIKVVPRNSKLPIENLFSDDSSIQTFTKTHEQFFKKNRLDVWPQSDRIVASMNQFPLLMELGKIRQGIAENPASINQRTLERFRADPSSNGWRLDEGVFSLNEDEIRTLAPSVSESALLRPYHDLCDLGRYWAAKVPSRWLIYSTRTTCPVIEHYPVFRQHLNRFRAILEARRETKKGSNRWWHLHWPRDERLWLAKKVVILQMANRPSFVPTIDPTYVSFSANVFIPTEDTREDLRYLCGLLNSRTLWAWFQHKAKHRGIGLELNGHVLEQAPIRRINFQDPGEVRLHDELVALVDNRLTLEQSRRERPAELLQEIDSDIDSTESKIDSLVCSLYQLDPEDVESAIKGAL